MDTIEKKELLLVPDSEITLEVTNPEKLERSIEAIHLPLSNLLKSANLPTDDILMPVQERKNVLLNLSSVLENLPVPQRVNAKYVSKFTLSVVIGLFDGALTYLWDETIAALRKLVSDYDLEYFFLIATDMASRYKGLKTSEDLAAISDYDLLQICSRMGLISTVNCRRLENVNYMRNHASSAHPSDEEISGMEMVAMLETCLKHAITAIPDQPAQNIKILLRNIRTNIIPEEDYECIGKALGQHTQERLDDLIKAVFGLFISDKSDVTLVNNILGIAPYLWNLVTDDVRKYIGMKFGYFRVNGFVREKELTQSFLNKVDGNSYKDEDSLAAEIIDHLGNLISAHNSFNNFYNENEYACRVYRILEKNKIPDSVRKYLVKVVTICHIGNGLGYREGVDERADRFYVRIIDRFTDNEIVEFINLFEDSDFTRDFHLKKPDERIRSLCEELKIKTKNRNIINMLNFLISFPPMKMDKASTDYRFKDFKKYLS